MTVLALTLESAKWIAVAVVVVLLIAGAIAAKVTTSVARKAVSLVICVGLVVIVWTQRSSLQRCADSVKEIPDGRVAVCQFFGQDVTIKAPTR